MGALHERGEFFFKGGFYFGGEFLDHHRSETKDFQASAIKKERVTLMAGTLVNIKGQEVGDMNERGEFAMCAGFHRVVMKADGRQDVFGKVPLAQKLRAGFGVVEIGMFL